MKKPKPEDIQKEFEDFVHEKFGDDIEVLAREVPFAEKGTAKIKAKEDKEPLDESCNFLSFDYKPKDIKAYLDKFVIGQTEAKKQFPLPYVTITIKSKTISATRKAPKMTTITNRIFWCLVQLVLVRPI